MRIWLAIRAFFAVLFDARLAAGAQQLLQGDSAEQRAAGESGVDAPPSTPPASAPTTSGMGPPGRNAAITLLEALQREARFVDIVKEPLGEYSNDQVGAAARDVLRDCGAVLDRFFALQPAIEGVEGAEIETAADVDPGRYRLTGNASDGPPFRGKLVHHGWLATRCELPTWSGSKQASMIVAPVELQID